MLDSYLKRKKIFFDEELKALFANKRRSSYLFEAAHYALSLPAKRLRPILALSVVDSVKKKVDLAPLLSLELIHTYSLIHDDLPCMDNSDLRRGKPSLHKKFPEWLAILTGDFLLTFSFELIAKAKIDLKTKDDLILSLCRGAGAEGMIQGQIEDMLGKKELKSLERIYLNKTAMLFCSSLEMGGLLAKVKKKDLLLLKSAALKLGVAFQIADDLLDGLGSNLTGKPKGIDLKNDKTTVVQLLGKDTAKKRLLTLYSKALAELSKLSFDSTLLAGIAKKMVERNC